MSNVFIAQTVKEACELLASPNRIACAGATNLYVDRYFGKMLEPDLVSLHAIDELKRIEEYEDYWLIGSMVTFDQLENTLKGSGALEALSKAASLVGGPQIRNRGTIGGNIISASPSADSLPVLMALDAQLLLQSSEGSRQVAIQDFMTGVKRTDLKEGELLTQIQIPKKTGHALFQKVGKRNALAIAVCNLCTYINIEENQIKDIAIAIGSCAPTCVRAKEVEKSLLAWKKPADDNEWKLLKEKISEKLPLDICPIDDVRATASYRKKVAANIIFQQIKELMEV
ncbi:MAG: FAD binding domain-containing protein [Eubacteriales bacterium]|nr:FAD binding domain-containing protein [Eubacteriales bacterium]